MRPFGGMTTHYGEGTAQRTCAAADRTGHAILHTLYQQSLRHDAEFFIEYFAIDLLMDDDGACRGRSVTTRGSSTAFGSGPGRDRSHASGAGRFGSGTVVDAPKVELLSDSSDGGAACAEGYGRTNTVR